MFETLPIFMMKRRGFKKIVRENKMKKSKFCFAYFHLWRCAYFWNKQKFCRPRITWSDRYQESWYYLLDQTCKSIQSTWLMFFWLSKSTQYFWHLVEVVLFASYCLFALILLLWPSLTNVMWRLKVKTTWHHVPNLRLTDLLNDVMEYLRTL